MTPLILVFARGEQPSLPSRWFGEGLLLLCVLVAINLIVFRGELVPAESNYPLIYLSITIMVWVALRMNQRTAVTAVFVVAALAIWSTSYGIGPFAHGAPAARFLLLNGFLAILAFMTLSLSTVASRRARLWEAVRASNELKSRLIDASPDCIKLLNAEGRLLSMNAGGMVSLEIDDLNPLLKTSWIDFLGGEYREAACAAIATANSGQVGRFAGYCPTMVTGTPKWWDNLVTPIFDAEGRIEQLLTISRDVTEHKQAEDALRGSETQKRAFLESALECVIGMDHAGRVIEFNPAAEKTFGYQRHQLIGKPLSDYIIPPRLRELHSRGLRYYLATGRGTVLSKRMELTAMRADDSEFVAEITIEPIALNGQPIFTAFLRDISERKAAEDASQRSAAQRAALSLAGGGDHLHRMDGRGRWGGRR